MPVLYAGEDLACALGETVFHDLSDDPAITDEVFRADFEKMRASRIVLNVDVELADLTDATLPSLGTTRDDVVNTPPSEYPLTSRWGQLVWNLRTAHGLVWNSRRSPTKLAFMLFVSGGSAAPNQLERRQDIDGVGAPVPLYDGVGLAQVLAAATSRNVTIVF